MNGLDFTLGSIINYEGWHSCIWERPHGVWGLDKKGLRLVKKLIEELVSLIQARQDGDLVSDGRDGQKWTKLNQVLLTGTFLNCQSGIYLE